MYFKKCIIYTLAIKTIIIYAKGLFAPTNTYCPTPMYISFFALVKHLKSIKQKTYIVLNPLFAKYIKND